MAIVEIDVPLRSREQGWRDLRERLARAAREIHFSAVTCENDRGAVLLTIAGNIAALAMSIPLCLVENYVQPPPVCLVDSTTLLATQILQKLPLVRAQINRGPDQCAIPSPLN
jgi:hypothetical protein